MDRNTVFGLIAIFVLFLGWSYFMQPSEEEVLRQQMYADSMMRVEHARLDSLAILERVAEAETGAIQADTASLSADSAYSLYSDKLGVFAPNATGSDQLIVFESDLLEIRLSPKGGKVEQVRLKNYQTYDSLPLILYNPGTVKFGLEFFSNNRLINTNDLYFQAFVNDRPYNASSSIGLNNNDSVRIAMRLYPENGLQNNQYLEYVYTLRKGSYMVGFDINLLNMDKLITAGNSFLNLNWVADLNREEKSLKTERDQTTIYYKMYKDAVDYLSERGDDNEIINEKLRWVSFKSRFFLSTLIAKNYLMNAELETMVNPQKETQEHYLQSMSAQIGLPYGGKPVETIPLDFYFGPNKYSILNAYDLGLEKQIPLGWGFFLLAWINIYAVIPVFDFLGSFGWNYGIIILILTILLKIVLFPIAYKTYMSSAKMRVLKPEIDEISKKFPKKEDAMKKQQATMTLYKKAGANPMSGCVPMALQMPILIAMFRFFPSSIELRQQSFLWATDLSSYDAIISWSQDIPIITWALGNHLSLFTLLMTISTLIYTKMNNEMMGSGNAQMPGMKSMMYIMPIMFLGFFNSYASALSYYYLLANLITFAQMFIFRKVVNEDKLRLKIQAHKKKPIKKSKFQQRLEEVAKQKGLEQRKK